jgi:hypothetical protein
VDEAFRVRPAVTVLADVAVMVTGVAPATLEVVTVKVALVWPAGTETLAGTVAAGLFEVRVTLTPAEPAGAPSVTVPVEELPPVTVVGLSETPIIVPCVVGAPTLIVKLAAELFAEVAVIVTVVLFATLEVVTVNVALVWPAATDTLAGTVAAWLFDDSPTVTPAAPAAAERVTVPVEELPPVTVDGLSETLVIVPSVLAGAALIVKPAVVLLAEVAVIVTGVLFATLEVVTVNVALVWPAATDTLAGTVAA